MISWVTVQSSVVVIREGNSECTVVVVRASWGPAQFKN